MSFYIKSDERGRGTYPMDAIETADAFSWLCRFRCPKCVKHAYDRFADPDYCDGIVTRKKDGWKCSKYRCDAGWGR